MKTKHFFAAAFVLGLFWTGYTFANAGGPPGEVNGVTGPTCYQADCHNTAPSVNVGGVLISIGGLPVNWTPGTTYNLTVTISRAAARYGFQFSAVSNATNAQAGTLLTAVSPADPRVSIVPFNGRQYAQHNAFANTTGVFNFRWVAPELGAGTVRFNVAGNAANGDFNNTGDFIYATAVTVSPAAGDTTPPVISAVTSTAVTSSSATITWTTDEDSDSQVEFGLTTAYGQTSALNPTMTKVHSVNLTGLASGTTFHYRVKSRDAAGNLATGGDNTFNTATVDTAPPVISSVTATGVTSSSAVISWTTDEDSDSQVEFGLTTAYGQTSTLNPTMTKAHLANLTGLASGTTFHYRVKSRDAAGNLATGGNNTFNTATVDTTPPVISAVTAAGVTSTSAVIAWTTNEDSDSQVEYGLTTAYGQTSALNPTATKAHSVNLTGLASATTFHYRVKSRDGSGNLITGSDNTFITGYSISNLGGVSRATDGLGSLGIGYARIQPNAGNTAPSGVGIFGLRQGGVLVTEAGVPDSPLITSGRTYAEVSETLQVNTGMAMANPHPTDTIVSFAIRRNSDPPTSVFRSGTFTLKGTATQCVPSETTICNQMARFLHEPPFLAGSGLQGTLSFTSTQPVSVIALRGLFNERTPSEFLITTLPVLDLSVPASTGTRVVSYFVVGESWTTQVLLVNSTGTDQTGTLQVLNANGAAQVVSIDGQAGSSSSYSVPANGSKKLVITGALPGVVTGSIRVEPTAAGSAPTPLVIFSLKAGNFTVSEAGVPVTMGSAFRMYAEQAPGSKIRTGLVIANATSAPGTALLSLTGTDGALIAASPTPLLLPAAGQIVGFLDELLPSVAGQTFQGVLRITTTVSTVSVVGLRLRINERDNSLMTTTSPTIESSTPGTSERLFPHVVNGGGFTTQVILFSGTAGQASVGTLSFVQQSGGTLELDIR